tara:strand:- start:797 stop:1219 length:423 start_codon:yes stop_codon:yes gene_type:complete
MDLTQEEIEFILESIQLSNPDPIWESLVEKIKRSDVALFPKISGKDILIINGKICPDCSEELEYLESDPSGRDYNIYYCPACENKEYHIWFDTRETGVVHRSLEPTSLRWLQRNIKINNADHSNVSEILKLIREVTRGCK